MPDSPTRPAPDAPDDGLHLPWQADSCDRIIDSRGKGIFYRTGQCTPAQLALVLAAGELQERLTLAERREVVTAEIHGGVLARLRAENERLRAALKDAARILDSCDRDAEVIRAALRAQGNGGSPMLPGNPGYDAKAARIRAALAGVGEEGK